MTPADRALLESLDQAVSEGLALGYSQRAIAEELNVTRDRVARSVKRLERAKANQAPLAEPAPDLVAELDREIAACLKIGDAMSAGRWARARNAIVESEDARKAAELAKRNAELPVTEDWTRLDDWECDVLVALTRKLNGEPMTHGDLKAMARFSEPPTPIEQCATCSCQAATRRHYLCGECLALANRARSGLPLVAPHEKLLGAAP